MAALRFYLDENISLSIAEQLLRHGIEVVTVKQLGTLGDSDLNHLARATEMGYVLCTHDIDYIILASEGITILASEGITHAGIIFGHQSKDTIGDWVKGLVLYHATYEAEEMLNRLEYL
jgi:hypothetical protein